MNFNHLYYFHVIAQEGSLARAAKTLHVTQPTLSSQLRQLEDYFHVKFFDRVGGGLRLNANGRQALEITQDMFRLAERLQETFPADRPQLKQRLEIGIATTVARSFAVNRFVELFRSDGLMIRVRQGAHEFLLHELVSDGLDLLITDSLPDQRNDKNAEVRVLSSPQFVIVSGQGLYSGLKEKSSAGLHNQPFIHYTSQSSYRFTIDQFLRENRIEPTVVAEADDVYVIRDAVVADVGFGIIPRSIIDEGDYPEKIHIIEELDQPFEIYALYNQIDPSDEVMSALDILSDRPAKEKAAD